MKNKVIKVKGNKTVNFDKIAGIVVGGIYPNKEYLCTADKGDVYVLEEIRKGVRERIEIKKTEFEKIKHQLIIK